MRNIVKFSKQNYPKIIFCFFFVFLLFFNTRLTLASGTNGTIDTTYKYAWGENIGWINFGCNRCYVHITDEELTGNVWSSQFGWINLKPSNLSDSIIGGVKNNGEGVLSGYAWSRNLGWINFSGVTINSSGDFSGYATVKSDGSKINFNCDGLINSCSSFDFKVKTDWRPSNARHRAGGGLPPVILPPVVTPPTTPTTPTVPTTPITPTTPKTPINPVLSIIDNIINFFKPNNKPEEPNIAVKIPQNAPLALNTKWNLLPVEAIHEFVFAPLPYEIRTLVAQFPELAKTLKSVGVERMTDMGKLTGVTLNLPGLALLSKTMAGVGGEKLTDINKLNTIALNVPVMSNQEFKKNLEALGIKNISDIDKLKNVAMILPGMSNEEVKKNLEALGIKKVSDLDKLKSVALSTPGFSAINGNMMTNIGGGKIAMISGLPLAKFSLVEKKNLPKEFVFARAAGELVDLAVAMSVGDKGEVMQKIASLPNEKMRLVVKPIGPAKSVTGYFVFKSPTPKISEIQIPRSSLTASALSSVGGLVEQTIEQIPVEQKLVLSSFTYTDPDHDGIYTADVIAPAVPGEYEVVTMIEYIDPELGTRKMSMITVVDPEGYVFEKNNSKETRIPSAIVSLYYLNIATKKYELWPAVNYQQENPQVTDVRGTYSFLVPEGSYYFEVEAPGYDSYQGKVFVVTEGGGIHQNIEMSSSRGLLAMFDWKTVLLVVVFLLLMYNLFRNSLRNELSKFFKKS